MKSIIGIISIAAVLAACNGNTAKETPEVEKVTSMKRSSNPVVYFEIPVTDMDRAIRFYTAVFNFTFKKDTIDHNQMALFPFTAANGGISGALAKGEIYKPSINGTLIYFTTADIDQTLGLALQNGAELLYPKTANGPLGYVAEFKDSEGNRIALHMEANQHKVLNGK